MIRLALVGTGSIAGMHATEFAKTPGCRVVAGCDVDAAKAAAFCAQRGIPKAYGDLDEMLKREEIDAVVNATPDRFHAPVALKIIAAGKHILSEKPLAMNHAEAQAMVRAVRKKGVINMVNLSYRSAASLHKARELVAAGKLGQIVHVNAAYLQSWLVSKAWGDWRTGAQFGWRLSTRHGSAGALGDLGVHIIDFATYVAGDIKTVSTQMKALTGAKGKRLGPYTLDANDTALINAEFTNGALGQIQVTRWATGHLNTIRLLVCGTKGALRIDLDQGGDKLDVCLGADADPARWQTITCSPVLDNIRRFARAVRTGKNDQPDFARGADVQKVLDACFLSATWKKCVEV